MSSSSKKSTRTSVGRGGEAQVQGVQFLSYRVVFLTVPPIFQYQNEKNDGQPIRDSVP